MILLIYYNPRSQKFYQRFYDLIPITARVGFKDGNAHETVQIIEFTDTEVYQFKSFDEWCRKTIKKSNKSMKEKFLDKMIYYLLDYRERIRR